MPPAQNLSPSSQTKLADKDAGKPTETQNPAEPPLVKPVIFRYTCRGALYLDDERGADDRTESIPRGTGHFDGVAVSNALSTPRCVGIESRLRKIMELPEMNRDDAIRDFIDRTAVVDVGYDGNEKEREVARTARRGGAVYPNPADAAGDRLPPRALPVGPDAADYGEGEDDGRMSSLGSKRRLSGGVKVGGEEDELDSDFWSTLSCYGTTQVSVLMLRDSKKAEVAAVAPENMLGITVRDEGDSTGGDAITTLRIGPVEVTVGNHYEFEEEDDNEQEVGDSVRDEGRDRARSSVGGKREDGMRPAAWPPGIMEERGRDRKDSIWSGNDGKRQSREGRASDRPRSQREEPPAEPVEDFSTRFFRNLNRTAEAMKNNAKIIKDEVNDDFPNRVVRSGERVIGQFGKTLERTKKVAMDVYRMWSNDDDDE